jgi:drug/metabolite transporter (DMT)-like permease
VRLTVDRSLWPHFLALGALFVAQHSVFFLGLIFLTPLFGVFLSWLLLGDPVTVGLVAGLVLVAAGIALVNRPA